MRSLQAERAFPESLIFHIVKIRLLKEPQLSSGMVLALSTVPWIGVKKGLRQRGYANGSPHWSLVAKGVGVPAATVG
jgi:hypothetical protein